MKKRMLDYLDYMNSLDFTVLSSQQKDEILKDLLIQIGFFQHERLIHLIVTALFAVCTIMSVCLVVLSSQLSALILTAALLILLVPYIKHYYLLENGVQKLYTYYDRLIK